MAFWWWVLLGLAQQHVKNIIDNYNRSIALP